MPRITSFAPLVGPSAKVLILGTVPGPRSRDKGEYYAHPRNSFWTIIERVLSIAATLSYAERTRRLTQASIAVWDVLADAERVDALDANITDEVPNDLNAFFEKNSDIRLVCFNGGKAFALYKRWITPTLTRTTDTLEYALLPSTSPMHTVSLDEKVKRWQLIANVRGRPDPSKSRACNDAMVSEEFIWRLTEAEIEPVQNAKSFFDESAFADSDEHDRKDC